MTEKDEEDYKNPNICWFFENITISDNFRDHCHLTSKDRVPAHNTCNINVTQKQITFIPLLFHIFSNYDCHRFFKKIVDKKKDKVDFKFIPQRNGEYISVRYGCIKFIDSYIILWSSLDKIVKTLVDNSHKTLKDFEEEIVDNDEILNIVNEIKILKKEDRYIKDSIKDLKKDCPERIRKLEKALFNYMKENRLKKLKTDFPDKCEYLTKKLA